eukprot:gene17292-biopygen8925
MLILQSWTKITKTQKPEGMRNARGTGELAGRLSKAAEGCRRQMKSRELLWRMLTMLRKQRLLMVAQGHRRQPKIMEGTVSMMNPFHALEDAEGAEWSRRATEGRGSQWKGNRARSAADTQRRYENVPNTLMMLKAMEWRASVWDTPNDAEGLCTAWKLLGCVEDAEGIVKT